VGEDARPAVAGRVRTNDKDYVAGGPAMPDAEYLDEMRERYGFAW